MILQVALKIIKHSQEEGAGGTDLVQGVLLGLVVDNRLEITNCFPFPRHTEEDDFDESQSSVCLPEFRQRPLVFFNLLKYFCMSCSC